MANTWVIAVSKRAIIATRHRDIPFGPLETRFRGVSLLNYIEGKSLLSGKQPGQFYAAVSLIPSGRFLARYCCAFRRVGDGCWIRSGGNLIQSVWMFQVLWYLFAIGYFGNVVKRCCFYQGRCYEFLGAVIFERVDVIFCNSDTWLLWCYFLDVVVPIKNIT